MTENDMTPPPIAPQATEIALPTPEKPTGDRKKLIIVISAVLGIGILLFGILYFQSLQPIEEMPSTPTPTEVPTPTPTPNVSRIATTSAFRSFSEEVASFSATLNSFTIQDSTLAPPLLDLELGL